MTATTRVHPRRDGDPAPDLLGLRLAHRALLRDADRLARVAQELAASCPVGPRRAQAVRAYVLDWAGSVHDHHAVEDELLWPVLVGSASPHLDLSELTGDHQALGRALVRLCRVADAFAARPGEDAATALALELAELRDALGEHVADEEAAVLPALERYVSVRDWDEVARRARRRARLSFELPRVRAVATAQEWPALVGRAGPLARALLAVLGPAHRRRERAVFGR